MHCFQEEESTPFDLLQSLELPQLLASQSQIVASSLLPCSIDFFVVKHKLFILIKPKLPDSSAVGSSQELSPPVGKCELLRLSLKVVSEPKLRHELYEVKTKIAFLFQ